MDALVWRLLVFVSHVASALFLGAVARRYLPSPTSALTASVAFVLPAGFSSMWVWFPSGGCVPLGMVGITGATLAIASRDALGSRTSRLVAAAGVVWAVVFENGLVPLVACPALLDEWERRRSGREGRGLGLFAAFCLAVMAAAVLATSVFYRRLTGASIEVEVVPAVLRTAFLLLAAPFRLLFPGQHPPRDLGTAGGSSALLGAYGLVVALLVAAVLAALLVRRAKSLVVAAALLSVGPAGFVGLVAIARARVPFSELFDSDRYFYPLLVPGALLAAAVLESLRERAREWPSLTRRAVFAFLVLLVAVELPLHAFAVRRRVPFEVYATHRRRYEQLARLGEMLVARAEALPAGEPRLLFPDGAFYFKDVHNQRLSARFLLHVASRVRSDRLQLATGRVDSRNETLVNEVLDAWSSEVGLPSPSFRVVDGELRDGQDMGAVRFGLGACDAAVLEGFHGWEGALRWAGPRAVLRLRVTGPVLRLRLATPVSALSAALPGVTASRVAVSLRSDSADPALPVGVVTLTGDTIADHVLPLPAGAWAATRGQSVRLTLEGSPAWRPRDVIRGAIDDRLLTVQVYEAAFEDVAVPEGHSK